MITTNNTDAGYWRFQILFWTCYAVFYMSFAVHYAGWTPAVVVGYLLYLLYSIGLTHLLHLEFRRWRGLHVPKWKRILETVLAILSVGLVQTFLFCFVDFLFEGRNSLFYHRTSLLATAWGTTAAVAIWVYAHEYRAQRERHTQLQLKLREAELSVLEAQINPHFLFNSLNSIRALVAENPAKAQDMITRLANIFRYNLHRAPTHTTSLSSEVEAVGDYLALESVRFEDRLRVRMEISPEAGKAQVPSMLLQTLVENALKHGIATRPSGGELTIRATREPDTTRIEVENSGQLGPALPSDRDGIGLANTRERLSILYGDRASLQLRDSGESVVATALIPA